MGFESLTGRVGGKGRPRGTGHPAALTVSCRKGSRSPGGEVWYGDRLLFRIAESLWKAAGLGKGAKVEVLFDRELMLGLIKRSDRGYSLTPSNPSASFDLKFIVPFDADSGFPAFAGQTELPDARVEEGSILFRVPRPGGFASMATNHQGKGATSS